ncbi:MAG TPA: SIS domain-containing protein [Bryobacteraceae bacterium]|jgi:glucosamine--fructose-6-phosphate aminotransferase (isomerizing)|nr:SIS domain-containing protein [Bryobacteraceae bacterium]
MQFDPAAVDGPYLHDILAQPGALQDTVAGLCDAPGLPDLPRFDRIVLTGMGASYHALHPLWIQLVEQGFHAVAYETSELIYYYAAALAPRTLLVAVSQSGRSAEILRLDAAASAPGHSRVYTIGVTNTPESPLASRSDFTILTHAGAESSVSCKTFVATLVALEWLGAALGGAGRKQTESTLREAAPAAQDYLARWQAKVESLVTLLDGVGSLFLTGRGTSLAAAGAGGLIPKESAHFHAEGMTCSAFRHGPFEMSGPGVFVLVFAGDPKTVALNEKLVADVRHAGGRAALVGPQSDVDAFRIPLTPPAIRPVLEILPVQLVTLALAALAGHQPGKFSLLTKVTTIE